MKTTAIAAITLLILSFTFHAQSLKPRTIYAKKSTFELGGEIFLSSTTYTRDGTLMNPGYSYSITDFAINGSGGIFVIDGLKLSIDPVINIRYFKNSTSTLLKLYFTPEYVFDVKSNIYPYLGASAGFVHTGYSGSGSDDNGAFSWGVKGGLKINAFGNALINAGFSYYRENYKYSSSYYEDKEHHDIFGFRMGFSVFFK
jgi:opacity protein-like surface antigen